MVRLGLYWRSAEPPQKSEGAIGQACRLFDDRIPHSALNGRGDHCQLTHVGNNNHGHDDDRDVIRVVICLDKDGVREGASSPHKQLQNPNVIQG